MQTRVVIVGGGLAGLAAATALADRDVPVTLLESRPRLGGRAASFVDRVTGERIDNCQHVSMGCCTNFNHFCERLGLTKQLRRERTLYFVGPDDRVNRFKASRLPAPLHLLPAFRKLSYLSRTDVRGIGRGLNSLARLAADGFTTGESFLQWLQRHDQTQSAIDRFWHVVLVSALSETLDRIDVGHARKVFVDAFLANRRGWEVIVPTVPLDDFYGDRLLDRLSSQGATVRTGAGVESFEGSIEEITSVRLRKGECVSGTEFIAAVPHDRLPSLVPGDLRSRPEIADAGKLETAPISSVHLWCDREFSTYPHAVFVDRLSQWFFNRSLLQSSATGAPPGTGTVVIRGRPAWYYQVVISASRNLKASSQRRVVDEVVSDLFGIRTCIGNPSFVHWRVVTEHRAVFSPTPGCDALRPIQQSPCPNLQLAGDWTRTGWPATMEGAVRSGYLAAENILRRLGRPAQVVQPDLPKALLSRWMLGL